MAALIEEVVEPYRIALTGRIAVDVQNDGALPQISLDRTLFSH